MPGCPHSYVVRGEQLSEAEFMRAVLTIRRYGEPGKFEGRTAIYLTVGPYKYWTMGSALERSTVINRADASLVYGVQDAPGTRPADEDGQAAGALPRLYTEMAPHYDGRYVSPECRSENIALWRAFVAEVPRSRPRVLDLGAGTGLVLDLGLTKPDRYRAVDPAQGMLNELIRKYPAADDVWACSVGRYRGLVGELREAECLGPVGGQPGDADSFDVATALFSASYLSPEELRWVAFEAAPVAIMIHYRPGYLPGYELQSDAVRSEAEALAAASWVELERIRFDIAQGHEHASFKIRKFGADEQYVLSVVRQLPEAYRARMAGVAATTAAAASPRKRRSASRSTARPGGA